MLLGGLFACACVMPVATAREAGLYMIPKPASVRPGRGALLLDGNTRMVPGKGAEDVAEFVALESGLKVGSPRSGSISLSLDPTLEGLGEEGYRLTVFEDGATLRAPRVAGLYYAWQSLRQLLPPEAEGDRLATNGPWLAPALTIEDKPRFRWRGVHLDVSRHFFPASQVKRLLDQMARLKLNVFHWHLVDDGGWRIEIRKYPRLTSVGAWRTATERWSYTDIEFPGLESGKRLYGGYYTQDEIRDVVAYAARRNITVMPEIEMPGHSYPSLVAYPELGCQADGSDLRALNAVPGANVYCAGKERTFQFLQDVLDEVMELFPGKYLHVGGDEVLKELWGRCPDCQRRMEEEGLNSGDELQGYFMRRIARYLESKGRCMVGWDEIAQGGAPPSATVMAWHSQEVGNAAAKGGHDVVMAPIEPCYFGYGFEPNLERSYRWDPAPMALSEKHARHVLGGETCIWTEWLPTFRDVEFLIYPGLLGIAESLWGPREGKNYGAFLDGVQSWYRRLDAQGVNYYVRAPQPNHTLVVCGTGTPLEFAPAPKGFATRYTTDGSEPTVASPLYRGPMIIGEPCVVKAATFSSIAKHSQTTRVRFVDVPPVHTELEPGLWCDFAAGRWGAVPDFAEMGAHRFGVEKPSVAPYESMEHYAMRFSGYFRAPKAGRYRFFLGSDDGSYLKLCGETLVDNDGLHAYEVRDGSVILRAGLYPIEIGFVQGGEKADLKLEVSGPRMQRCAPPAALLLRPRGK